MRVNDGRSREKTEINCDVGEDFRRWKMVREERHGSGMVEPAGVISVGCYPGGYEGGN